MIRIFESRTARWRRNNGLNATKMLGANFATETEKLELGGSMRYNYRDADVVTVGSSQRFLQSGDSYSDSNKANRNKETGFNADSVWNGVPIQ